MAYPRKQVVIIGAGIGGLAAAMRLAHSGMDVEVLEAHPSPGGKMRTFPTPAGPADAGPTVLTLRPVFERLFQDVGLRLENHVALIPATILARHFWPDGAQFDLGPNREENCERVRQAFGSRAAKDFRAFTHRAQKLFAGFDRPMMQAAAPSQMDLTRQVLTNPSLLPAMAPHRTLSAMLSRQFKEPRLAQLFARYATYVGGLPAHSPALLSLISEAEAQGVWHVKGGMHALAKAMERAAISLGAVFKYDAPVSRIECQGEQVVAVHTEDQRYRADMVVFNGDPRALAKGALGGTLRESVPESAVEPRSLSAFVYAFAATPSGPELAGHNVFFGADPADEFEPLANGQMPRDPTLYICAQDRIPGQAAPSKERFEIIMNGPPVADTHHQTMEEEERCQKTVFNTLRSFGLTFDPTPMPCNLTTPTGFARLFPMSNGSLYGRSPHGMTAGLNRPLARTAMQGLYLVGGGAHPGAGVPMATLSAKHAAEAILSDLTSTSTYPQAATHGGMSTA